MNIFWLKDLLVKDNFSKKIFFVSAINCVFQSNALKMKFLIKFTGFFNKY